MAHSLLQSAVGVLVLLLSNGGLAYAAHLTARRFFAAEPTPIRWAATGMAFVALVLITTQALSALSLYNRPAVVLACVAIGGLVHWAWGEHRALAFELECLRGWLRVVIDSRGAVLFCAAAVAVLLSAGRAVSTPPVSWDSLTYHLFLAARYVQHQQIVGFVGPPMMDHYDHFPINGEMMAAWLLLPFGTDLLVGFLSFPFLALGGVALYGLCREVGARWEEASLAACLMCFSPFLFAYLTTQDVDIQVFAAVMCCALFVLRYLQTRRAACAVAACVAIGIAVGTKHTALALGTMFLVTVVFGVLREHLPHRDWRAIGASLGCGFALAGVVGGRKYVEDWWETGNPIYPLQVTVAGHQILPGSAYTDMISDGGEVGSRKDDLVQLVDVFNYYPTWRQPTSGGPKFFLLLVLALGSVAWAARERHRWPVLLLAAYGFLGAFAFYLPGDGFPALARRLWPGAAARFLAGPFALLVASAMPAIAMLRARVPALLGVLAAFTLWDMMVANTTVAASFPIAVGVGTALTIPVVWMAPWRRWLLYVPRPVWAGLLVLAAVVVAALLQETRDGNRWLRYKQFTDVSFIPRDFADGWQYCDQPDHPRHIALAAGWEYRGQNFFFYPLLGRRLQNSIVHVPAHASAAEGASNDSGAWVAALHRERVDTVFVEKPWPIEDSWMRELPNTFTLLKSGDGFKVYGVAAP